MVWCIAPRLSIALMTVCRCTRHIPNENGLFTITAVTTMVLIAVTPEGKPSSGPAAMTSLAVILTRTLPCSNVVRSGGIVPVTLSVIVMRT